MERSKAKRSAPAGRRPATRTDAPARYVITDEQPTVSDVRAPEWHAPRRRISATAAARTFSELISRVCYKGETYVIEKGGKPMCEISPVESDRFTGADFLAILGKLPKPAEEFLAAVEDVTLHQPRIELSPWE